MRAQSSPPSDASLLDGALAPLRTSAGSGGFPASFATVYPQLLQVEKPARYIGGEQGARRISDEDWKRARFRLALGFPDLYEMGMAYGGMQVLYAALNESRNGECPYLCERYFLPAPDMQKAMTKHGARLFTLESKREVADFDAVGFSLTHEGAYTNMLRCLRLAGIPLWQAERTDEHPLVIAGGGAMFNPEPVADFLDAVAVGDGEELVLEIAEALAELRRAPRKEKLLALANIPGMYVPSFYHAEYDSDGNFKALVPRDGLPKGFTPPYPIVKRLLGDFAKRKPLTKLVLSHLQTWGNAAAIEVMRGCPRHCRFCQAGYTYLPPRPLPPKRAADAAIALADYSGEDQVSLESLSTLDHPGIARLVARLQPDLAARGVRIGLPSSRIDALGAELARTLHGGRETSLTFAPESASERLRDAINKSVSEETMQATLSAAMQAGWHKFKLYFMYGFPGETTDDIAGIPVLVRGIKRLAKKLGAKPPRINVSLNVFIPKAHAPMQWAPLATRDDLRAKLALLRDEFARFGKSVHFSYRTYEEAFVETLLSRGDRRLGKVIALAEERGLIFQSDWENFDFAGWQQCWDDAAYPATKDVHRARERDEPLPWDHISSLVRKDFLWEEWQKYSRGEPTPGCFEKCVSCGLPCTSARFPEAG